MDYLKTTLTILLPLSCCLLLVALAAGIVIFTLRRKKEEVNAELESKEPRASAVKPKEIQKPAESSPKPTPGKCPSCGSSNPLENNFCEQCGAPLK